MSRLALSGALLGAGLVGTLATSAPLLVYSLTLAAFGLPHVLVELRYVDERFRPRLSGTMLGAFGLLLGAIVLLRVLAFSGATTLETGAIELTLVLLLVSAAGASVGRRSPGTILLAMLGAGALAAGALWAPLTTLVLLAVLHNLTPIGFLADALRGRARRRAMLLCGVTFGLIPLLILTGWPMRTLASAGVLALDLSWLPLGSLQDHLGAFVPATWHGEELGVRLFSAAAYLQCLHYAVVLYVLPRLPPAGKSRPLAERGWTWPSRGVFTAVVAAASAVFLIGFGLSFPETRTVYGFFAAVHAWVELPVLLIALGGSSWVTRGRAAAR